MNSETGSAQVLVIGEDTQVTAPVVAALRAAGFEVKRAARLIETASEDSAEPDLVVLCGLAAVEHPGRRMPVLRVHDGITPEGVAQQVHRRIALRAVLHAVEDAAA
jgi:hypothetical protein